MVKPIHIQYTVQCTVNFCVGDNIWVFSKRSPIAQERVSDSSALWCFSLEKRSLTRECRPIESVTKRELTECMYSKYMICHPLEEILDMHLNAEMKYFGQFAFIWARFSLLVCHWRLEAVTCLDYFVHVGSRELRITR